MPPAWRSAHELHYHGTCDGRASAIRQNGWRDGTQLVLTRCVDVAGLRADHPAFEEPLTFYRSDWADSETDWHERLADGEIPFPEADDGQTSLHIVRSVMFAGPGADVVVV